MATAARSALTAEERSTVMTRARVRWWIFAFMFGFAFLAYLQRQIGTIAAERMMPELGFSQLQIGFLYWAFMLGYTLLQLGGGIYGQKFGARRTFIGASAIAVAAAVATPLAPSLLTGTPLFVMLLAAQLVLGVAQAPVFPVSAGVFESWFQPQRWALVLGLQTMGMNLGAALAPPLIASLMQSFGWRPAMLVVSLAAIPVIALWAWYGRDTPAEHPGVSRVELAELGPATATVNASIDWRRLRALLADREVLLITGSYLCMNYVFYLLSGWCFLYLVQERHFTVLESGWLASGPPLAAALGAGIGGKLAGALCDRYGPRWGFRLVPLVALPLAGALLIVAVEVRNAYWAVTALSGAFAAAELIEGPIWAAMMYVARADTMSATGILNTGGSLGGVIGIPIVAYLSGEHLWTAAILIGSGAALVSGLLWIWIDASRRVDAPVDVTVPRAAVVENSP
jgi:ACS family glucarate transporter-like MFS transporter